MGFLIRTTMVLAVVLFPFAGEVRAQSAEDIQNIVKEIMRIGGDANPNCPSDFMGNVCWCYGGGCGGPGHVHSSLKRNYEADDKVGLVAAYVKCQKHRIKHSTVPGTPIWQFMPNGGRCTVGNMRNAIAKWYKK